MAEKKKTSQAQKAAADVKRKKSGSTSAKTAPAKPRPAPVVEQDDSALPQRVVAALVALCLALIFLLMSTSADGALLKVIHPLLLGMFGKVSFVFSIPALLYMFVILVSSGKEPVRYRCICLILFALMSGCIQHLLVSDLNFGDGNDHLLTLLYKTGLEGKSGGVICGLAAMTFAYLLGKVLSYILFGLALLQPQAMTGALLHVVFHAVIKSCLFLSAGAIIYKTHKTNVSDLRGIGKEMPVTIWCYTFAAAALIGIPPASGFISKWYLATGALGSGISVFSWLGPVVLLTSALLTAGYLLPITVNGFLPGADFDYAALEKKEPCLTMRIPLLIFAALAVLLGIFPDLLTEYLSQITAAVL